MYLIYTRAGMRSIHYFAVSYTCQHIVKSVSLLFWIDANDYLKRFFEAVDKKRDKHGSSASEKSAERIFMLSRRNNIKININCSGNLLESTDYFQHSIFINHTYLNLIQMENWFGPLHFAYFSTLLYIFVCVCVFCMRICRRQHSRKR